MKRKKLLVIVLAIVVLLLLAGGGAWFYLNMNSQHKEGEAERPTVDKHVYKYLSLDKVVVMLRATPAEGATAGPPHYMAVDLVFKAPQEKEKVTKEHLPMLRSVAVKALSAYAYEVASAMTIDQFAASINRAYSESYARDGQEKPFTEVMIGKLIIE